MIEEAIKRIIFRLFPELTAKYHLPQFGRVEAIRETPGEGDICDEFRPFYAVDVQVLTEHGKPDKQWPVLKDVPLSLPVAGQEMGQWAFPDAGTWVEIAFAYGSPNRPFIRCVLPHGLSQAPIERGEQRWQHNSERFQRADKHGNWDRKTDGKITDESIDRLTVALDSIEKYHIGLKETQTDDTELIGAIKTIKAFGAMIFLSGGRFDLGSLHDFNINCQAVTNIVSRGNINTSSQAVTHIASVGDINTSSQAKTNINSEEDINLSGQSKTEIASADNVTISSQEKISLSGKNATLSSDQFQVGTDMVDIYSNGNSDFNCAGEMTLTSGGEINISGLGFAVGAAGFSISTAVIDFASQGPLNMAMSGDFNLTSDAMTWIVSQDDINLSGQAATYIESVGDIKLSSQAITNIDSIGDINLSSLQKFSFSGTNAILNSDQFQVGTGMVNINSLGNMTLSSAGEMIISGSNMSVSAAGFGVSTAVIDFVSQGEINFTMTDDFNLMSYADVLIVSDKDMGIISYAKTKIESVGDLKILSLGAINITSSGDTNIIAQGKMNISGDGFSLGDNAIALTTASIDLNSLSNAGVAANTNINTQGDLNFNSTAVIYDLNGQISAIPAHTELLSQGDITLQSKPVVYINSYGQTIYLNYSQFYKAPKTWIGSETENLFKLLSELMQVNSDLCTALAAHTHLDVGDVSNKQADILNSKTSINSIKVRLDGITSSTPS